MLLSFVLYFNNGEGTEYQWDYKIELIEEYSFGFINAK